MKIVINNTNLIYIYIIILSTAFSSFIIGNGVNVLVVLMLSLMLMFSKGVFTLDKQNCYLYLLLVFMIVSSIINIHTLRIVSLLYSLMFVLSFLVFNKHLRSISFDRLQFIKMLKFILFSYFFVLILQQISVVLGFSFIPNEIYIDASAFKLNSLATEPSYSVMYVMLLYYVYLKIYSIHYSVEYNLKIIKQDKFLFYAVVYIVFTSFSSFGYLLIISFLVTLAREIKVWQILLFVVAFISFIFLLSNLEINAFDRLLVVVQSLMYLDPQKILMADHSAAMRIVPGFVILQDISTISINTLFGNGIDYSSNYLSEVIPGINPGSARLGFVFTFILDYGLINYILILLFIYKCCIDNIRSFDTFVLLLVGVNSSFNTQLFWFAIAILSIKKYVIEQNLKQKNHEFAC